MKILFAVYSYNDFDHMIPVIWKCLLKKEKIIILNVNPIFNLNNDIKFLYIKKKI